MLLAGHGTLAVHGVAMRPSSPTGFGPLDDALVFLLPGNPVSALCAYDFFAGRAIRALGGRPKAWPYAALRGTLVRKISSPIGRLDYARVRLEHGRVEPLSVSGASLLSSTTSCSTATTCRPRSPSTRRSRPRRSCAGPTRPGS